MTGTTGASGPQSAGASPGPACYALGELDPAVAEVTDRIPFDEITAEIDRANRMDGAHAGDAYLPLRAALVALAAGGR